MRIGTRVGVVAGLLLGVGLSNRSFWRWIADVLPRNTLPLQPDIVAFAAHPSGQGGWSLDRMGNIFAFGIAPEFRRYPSRNPGDKDRRSWRLRQRQAALEYGPWTGAATSSPSVTLRSSARCPSRNPGEKGRRSWQSPQRLQVEVFGS